MDIRSIDMQQHFTNMILDGVIDASEEELKSRGEEIGLIELEPPYVVIVVSPRLLGHTNRDKDKILYDYKNYVGEFFDGIGIQTLVSMDSYDNVKVVLSINDYDGSSLFDEIIRLRKNLKDKFGIESFIGIGSRVSELRKIALSAREAFEALNNKYLYSVKGVVDFNTILLFQGNPLDSFDVEIDRVIGSFKDGNLERMKIRLIQLAEGIRGSSNISKTCIKRKLLTVILEVLTIGETLGVDQKEALDGIDPYKWVMEQNHTEVIIDKIMDICSYVRYMMDENIKKNELALVKDAQKYMEENIDNPNLNLDMVSKNSGLPKQYLNQLFRRKTGNNIIGSIAALHNNR